MTIFANIRGLNMSCILTGRVSAVVAARAVAGDIDMIEVGRDPARG